MREKIEILIENGYSIRSIAKELNLGYSTIRYWLTKHNLSTKSKIDLNPYERLCPKCKSVKEIDKFYVGIRNGKKRYGYCKECSNRYASDRVRKIKESMIKYKGGSCEKCGLSIKESNYFVFDFHHLDSKEKDPNFRRIKFQKWEKITKELDKCILVCSNCHRTIHYMMIEGSSA